MTNDQENAIGMQAALYSNTQDINTVLTDSNEVSPIFHGHFFQLEKKSFRHSRINHANFN